MAKKDSEKIPHRQIELRREIESGWEDMAGHIEVVLNFPDEDVPRKTGADFFAHGLSDPDKPWTVSWRSSYTSLQ